MEGITEITNNILSSWPKLSLWSSKFIKLTTKTTRERKLEDQSPLARYVVWDSIETSRTNPKHWWKYNQMLWSVVVHSLSRALLILILVYVSTFSKLRELPLLIQISLAKHVYSLLAAGQFLVWLFLSS